MPDETSALGKVYSSIFEAPLLKEIEEKSMAFTVSAAKD